MQIEEIQEKIVAEFSMFDDWTDRYEHLIHLGKSLPLLEEHLKTDDRLIKGCQSRVWLYARLEDGKVYYTADSDAILTKGIVSLLIGVFSEQKPQDILKSDVTFIDKTGLKEHLSPTRANGLSSMIKQIKLYALAFQTQLMQ